MNSEKHGSVLRSNLLLSAQHRALPSCGACLLVRSRDKEAEAGGEKGMPLIPVRLTGILQCDNTPQTFLPIFSLFKTSEETQFPFNCSTDF